MNIYECQNCGKVFEYEKQVDDEIKKFANTETPNCPYCYSGDVIEYEEEENE